MNEIQSNQVETKVYKKRWLVLVLLIGLIFLYVFAFVNFGYLNNVLVAYFHTSYAAVDWIVLGGFVGTMVASPVIGWLSLKNLLSPRKSMIVASILIIIGFTLIIVGFLHPFLFFLAVFGQVLNGIAAAILLALPAVVAQLWFSESQIGFATGFVLIGFTSGAISGYTVFSHVLKFEPNISTVKHNMNISNSGWLQYDKNAYQLLFLTLLVIAVLFLILLVTIVPEKPEIPPSIAQHLKRTQEQNVDVTFWCFALEIKKLCFDYKFIACSVASGVFLYEYAFFDLTVELIISKFALESSIFTPENISGVFMLGGSLGCGLANFTTGLLLDRFKKFYLQSNVAALFVLLCYVAIAISVQYQSFVTCILFYSLSGFCTRSGYISLIDSLMQHTYPTNPLFVMSINVFLQNIIAILYIQGGRQIIYHFGLEDGLVYGCIVMVVACLLCFIFKPDTKRLNAENMQQDAESVPLILK